ncbi:Signal transduction histidine kinase [Austwickia chelonae]|uniref:Oxygen sensor histidine kinase NreB n=1 Tax=Austwickia chelonae NBRC 105200 TaxID=1184607 RepID=K6VQX9_9MICO|nr:histidine kinase [Austwickia chelonae]GAB79149.1 putative two-component histidine kinase [Austwickia chelonae NBRC 105200]SEW42689.1 Signal transduction histidine kinase [Austwickia chelonae]
MPLTWASTGDCLRTYFALDDDWHRPAPTSRQRRNDLWVALGMWAFGALGMELSRSTLNPHFVSDPTWLQHLLIAAGTLPLIWRRTHPLTVMGLLQLHMFLCGITVTVVMTILPMQCVYVFALFTGVAWAGSRRVMLGLVAAVLVLMFGWLTWQFALGTALFEFAAHHTGSSTPEGIFPTPVALIALTFLLNIVYFGSGILGGQASWRQARAHAQLSAQADLISAQAEELADRKVVEERLRIARELHDVVAHHVSVMGIQAAAARRVMDKDPGAAAAALARVEESSRQAVGEMRGLLGTLRRTDPARKEDAPASASSTSHDPGATHRSPQPGVEQIAELVQSSCSTGFSVTYQVVEDGAGMVDQIPMPVGLTLYRTIQEALANVRRHSTAPSATVVLRIGGDQQHRYAEAEILDSGRPREGTSGSGLGLLGMRERVASHGGTTDIGPRVSGGYRVRVRLPLRATPTLPARGKHPTDRDTEKTG